MSKTVIVIGPQGCGKTLHAEALRQHFGCGYVFDNWRPAQGVIDGALMLTSSVPGGSPLPYSCAEFDAYAFDDAMRRMNAAHAAVIGAP